MPNEESKVKFTPPFKREEEFIKIDYTDKEEEYLNFIVNRMSDARDSREDSHVELDDKGYLDYYDTNYKTGNSYIRPKKNKEDTRIVTGTTLEKENTFLSMILNYNFEPNVETYDKEDLPLAGLGEKLESLIKKSRLIEGYEDKKPLIYKEGADQGTWFAEETWVEEWEIQKEIKNADYSAINVNKIKWVEKKVRKVIGAQVNLLPGTGVYLGNIKQFFMKKQPYVFTVDVIPYEEAKACYGDYDRF